MYALNGETGEQFELWRGNPPPEDSDWMYHFTQFTPHLNFINPYLERKIASTDTRLRPDQRALENGNFDLAASEKHRLEEKQRAVRKIREKKGESY